MIRRSPARKGIVYFGVAEVEQTKSSRVAGLEADWFSLDSSTSGTLTTAR